VSQVDTDINARLQHLLDVVKHNRDERCEALLSEAREQAQELIKQAYQDARKRLHGKVRSTREDARQRLAAAEAQRQTRARLDRQNADSALLERAWKPLNEQLLKYWYETDTRRQWIDYLIQHATENLVDKPWRIEHPADWTDEERTELLANLVKTSGSVPEFSSQTGIKAGLRICAGDARVDGTRRGLLRSRSRIEGIMLAKLNECRKQATGTTNDDNDKQPR
jgi:vacuolar-type H+-ATPase subunit E/Vma4